MINVAIQLIEQDIKHLYAQREALRDACKHNDTISTYKSDTGNWCRADDRYWIDHKCYDCGKQWTEDRK